MRAPLKSMLLRWRNKASCLALTNRRLRQQLKRKDEQLAELKADQAALEQRLAPTRVRNHVYPAELIALAVFMMVAGCSLRATAKTVSFVGKELFGWEVSLPSPSTIRNWLLRFGLSQLLDGAEKLSGDYVAIADESIQIGKEKLLLILGYPLALEGHSIAPLAHDQVEVLGMEVQPNWTGDQVAQMLQRCQKRLPNVSIVRVISDRGSSLLNAWAHLELPHVSDCTHYMMNVVKTIFGQDKTLQAFCRQVGSLRQRLAMTDYAFILPPKLRSKDRFCRVFVLVDWIKQALAYGQSGDATLIEHLGFVRTHRWLRLQLEQVHALLVLTARLLKRSGLSQSVYQAWQQQVAAYLSNQQMVTRQARQFVELMRRYFIEHAKWYQNGQRIMCCSDVIESTFGRYKNKGGMNVMSADVLKIVLYGKPITVKATIQAMQTTSQKKLEAWESEHVYENWYGVIRRLKKELKNAA